MRARSAFSFDAGMSTRRCFDPQALRMRVNMSAIGSVMLMAWAWFRVRTSVARLPARLPDAGNHSVQGQVAEANPAQAEFPQECARPTAALAAVVLPHRELRLALALFDHGLTSHHTLPFVNPDIGCCSFPLPSSL